MFTCAERCFVIELKDETDKKRPPPITIHESNVLWFQRFEWNHTFVIFVKCCLIECETVSCIIIPFAFFVLSSTLLFNPNFKRFIVWLQQQLKVNNLKQCIWYLKRGDPPSRAAWENFSTPLETIWCYIALFWFSLQNISPWSCALTYQKQPAVITCFDFFGICL